MSYVRSPSPSDLVGNDGSPLTLAVDGVAIPDGVTSFKKIWQKCTSNTLEARVT